MSISDAASYLRRVTTPKSRLDVCDLGRRKICKCLRYGQEWRSDSYVRSGRTARVASDNIAREKARFLPATLFKRKEEECPIFRVHRPAQGPAPLSTRVRRLFGGVVVDHGRKGVARLY